MSDTRHYGMGTSVTVRYPFGTFTAGRALCSDGKVRTLARISPTADTFFSVPAAVKVKGKTVTGFISFDTVAGYSTATDSDPTVVRFTANRYGKNAGLLPPGDGIIMSPSLPQRVTNH